MRRALHWPARVPDVSAAWARYFDPQTRRSAEEAARGRGWRALSLRVVALRLCATPHGMTDIMCNTSH